MLLKEECFVDFLILFYGVVNVLFLIAFNWHFISPLKNSLGVDFTVNIAEKYFSPEKKIFISTSGVINNWMTL